MIGTILIMIGFVIRLLVIKQMKDNYSMCLTKPNKLITNGWFKYMRHPSYLGSMLMITGMLLINEKFALLYITYMFFNARACQEDLINSNFFTDFKTYHKRTYKFFPKIINKEKDNG